MEKGQSLQQNVLKQLNSHMQKQNKTPHSLYKNKLKTHDLF